jgi:zinc protease
LLDRPDAPQSLILAGHLLPAETPEGDLALSMANTLYGGLFTSRLNMNLREDKAWSYGARSAIVGTQAQQPWVNYTRVQTPYTAAAVKEIQAEIRRMQRSGTVGADELSRAAKNRALKLPGQHETTAQVAASLLSQIMRQRPQDYLAELPQRLQSLRPTQVETAAQQHFFPQQLQWVIVGDVAKILPDLEKISGLGIRHLDQVP